MRISDWSSDVCSSDLCERVAALLLDQPRDVGGRSVACGDQTGAIVQAIEERRNEARDPEHRARHDHPVAGEIGRASGRDSGCQYVYTSVVVVSLKTKTITIILTTH